MQELSQGLLGGSTPWRRGASTCWWGHSGFLGSGNIKLLQRKNNCEVNSKKKKKKRRKEARVLWLTISKCHVSFQSRGLLIFASVSFNYAQRAILKSFRKRSQTFTIKDKKLCLRVPAFNSCSSHSEEQLKSNVRAGLMPGLTDNLWDTVLTWACPGLVVVYQSMFTARLFQFLNKDISDSRLIRLPIFLSQIENLEEMLQKRECFSWPRHKFPRSLHLRSLNLWGWAQGTHMSYSGSRWISLLEGLRPPCNPCTWRSRIASSPTSRDWDWNPWSNSLKIIG